MHQLEETLDTYLVKKAPGLPVGAKEFIVKVAPWVTLVLLILSLPVVLAFFGISAFLLPMSYMGGAGNGMSYTLAVIFLGLSLVLDALSIPGLFKRSRQGWNFAFYGVILNAVYNLINLNIVGLIIGTLISLYILFQIRSYYK